MNPAGPRPAPPSLAQPATPAPSTLRCDLLSAYAASGARVASWVVISALVFRVSPAHFAVLALVRGTLGLLNYTTVGLLPAMVRLLAGARRGAHEPAPGPLPADRPTPSPPQPTPASAGVMLDYARPRGDGAPLRILYSNGLVVALVAGCIGQLLVWAYASNVNRIHLIPGPVPEVSALALFMGMGFVLRLISEAPAAVIQTAGAVSLDNALVSVSEAVWVALTLLAFGAGGNPDFILLPIGAGYAASGLLLLLARAWAAARDVAMYLPDVRLLDRSVVLQLLGLGSLIAVAQLADFLYAPVDYIMINRLISPEAVAAYAPIVPVNAGLLLLVGGLSAVVLPRAAVAHAAGDAGTLRRYYLRGTLAAAGMLAAASLIVWALAPRIFQLWLGDPLPQAQAILPLILIHTVLGGSSGVGRSILLAAGKAKPYAAAALITGVSRVVLSYIFVRFAAGGLQGLALGTVVAVVGLSVVWQPWYVMRTLRRMYAHGGHAGGGEVAGEIGASGLPAPTATPL